MNWEAANAPKARRKRQIEDDADAPQGLDPSNNERKARKATETVEAALSRLTKAYNSSMACVGALNKTNAVLQRQLDISKENVEMLERVANAARNALESSILLDPLVVAHASTLNSVMRNLLIDSVEANGDSESGQNRWKFVDEKRPISPVLSSTAHKSTVRDLAYLSLVNYADLLVSCCPSASAVINQSSPPQEHRHGRTILDKGVVAKLAVLAPRHHSCWIGEPTETTQRLALSALCDASNLDVSDPTLWLKLACATRALERIQAAKGEGSASGLLVTSKYRRLQRYALEMGSRSLAPNFAPNLTVMRALDEISEDADEPPETYPHVLHPSPQKTELRLELLRYSWSALGRMLVRACREGNGYQSSLRLAADHFGSPSITLRLSPMLALPLKILGRICQFLESTSIWRFEATCRALSVSLVSARASIEQEKAVSDELQEQSHRQTDPAVPPTNLNIVSTSDQGEGKKKAACNETIEKPAQSYRTSKRLLSQLITSGKIAERENKRKSVEYCFLAAILGTTKEQHDAQMKALQGSKAASRAFGQNEFVSLASRNRVASRGALNDSSGIHRKEATERVSDCSLSKFVERWSGQNSGPMALLQKYLGHVAIHVADVFSSDPGGSMVLPSCLLGCFEVCIRRSGFHQGLAPRFYKGISRTGSFAQSLELFAIDLLHAELILRQSDRYSPESVEFDDDSNLISLMVPNLLAAATEIDRHVASMVVATCDGLDIPRMWVSLKTRCHWLAAGFFLWRSKISRVVSESLEAEEEGIGFLQLAAECFDSHTAQSVRCIQTPHLVAPGRSEAHWREISRVSLNRFRDEIQAASVVSLARQKFQNLLADVDCTEPASVIKEEDAYALAIIGETLFERYKSPYGDADAKHSELVEDFLAVHGEELLHTAGQGSDSPAMAKLCDFVPSGTIKRKELLDMTNPSILTILITCLNMKSDNRLRVAELLSRLILSTHDHQKVLLQRKASAKAMKRQSGTQFDDSDSDEDSILSDDGSVDRNTANKSLDEKIARQFGYLVRFLVERLCTSFTTQLNDLEKTNFMRSRESHGVIESALTLSSDWFRYAPRRASFLDDDLDLVVFESVRSLVRSFVAATNGNGCLSVQQVYLYGMMKTLISHRQILESIIRSQGDRAGRSTRQRLGLKRAEFIGVIAGELGLMLSQHLASVSFGRLVRSRLLSFSAPHAESSESDTRVGITTVEFSLFCDSLLWLSKYASQRESESATETLSAAVTCSAFDRPIVKELRVPIAVAVVGLCGATVCTRATPLSSAGGEERNIEKDDPLCLTEFYDTDASANDWASDDENSEKQSSREMLRAICHAVHCVDLVVRRVDEKSACSGYIEAQYGPLLPLVCARVLNVFADTLLLEFGTDDPKIEKRQLLWSEEYPCSVRTMGELLDSNLHKCYRWLYGFNLIGEKGHQHHVGKDLATSGAPIELATKHFIPESTSAAAQLYRCVVRAYAGGRRSPPKAALEVVSSALPPMQESAKSKTLRSFLFSTEMDYFTVEQVIALVNKADSWAQPFAVIHPHLQEDIDSSQPEAPLDEEVFMVRKGIYSELARGPLPVATGDSGAEDERVSATLNEEEMSKKFNVILDDLCLGDVRNSEGWYRASQCLTMKADLVADRLGLSKGFTRSDAFSATKDRLPKAASLPFDALEILQEQECNTRESRWLRFLSQDLSLFASHSWSSFASLSECSKTIGNQLQPDPTSATSKLEDETLRIQVWRELEALHQKGDFVQWQQAWGGLFVSALRQLAVRFLCVALYILQSSNEEDKLEKVLVSEICESIGVSFYSQLMASQNYGFPMHVMTHYRKRKLAIAAKECFQCAADIVDDPSKKDDDSESRATWDLLFMVGKCHEKIARTLQYEEYGSLTDVEPPKTRHFERHMSLALGFYAKSLSESKAIESDGGFIVEQAGGSAHGVTEVFYRLHASRLKVLISSVSRDEFEIERAELEALRLTGSHWFKEQESDDVHVRDRVWNVLTDIVTAMAQCRLDQQFFHRSVYRHAQALMWSPVLCDPVSGRAEGSLGIVPATRSFRVRGLNNSTHAANSAEVIMSSLFDRKRPQLCAVWVTTTTSSSPFQTLNTSIRKYDSLRGKYISGYIESLRLCRRRAELETFLKWAASSNRDLPSYFHATARQADGRAPIKSHNHDNLLVQDGSISSMDFLPSIKRLANSSLANVVLQDLSDSRKSPDGEKAIESNLKSAYACFLRLNCSPDEVIKSRKWKYGHGSLPEVTALCQAYLALGEENKMQPDALDWSGGGQKSAVLSTAIEKCRILFPSLSGSFFSKKGLIKSKRPDDFEQSKPNSNVTGKRKASVGATESVSFSVMVPDNLVEGNSFLTKVKVGGQTKKVKLTVPAGNPSTLRFVLQVPSEEAGKKS